MDAGSSHQLFFKQPPKKSFCYHLQNLLSIVKIVLHVAVSSGKGYLLFITRLEDRRSCSQFCFACTVPSVCVSLVLRLGKITESPNVFFF